MASTAGAGLSLAKNWDFQMTIDMRPGRMLQQCYRNVSRRSLCERPLTRDRLPRKPESQRPNRTETTAMITGTATRAGAVAIATVILFGAAILRGNSAAADPNQDDQFLAALDQNGIPALENAPSLIVTAHEVCSKLDGGMPADGVVESMTNFAVNNNSGLSRIPRDRLTRTFTRFVAAAVQAYCPTNQDKLASFRTSPTPGSNGTTHRAAAYSHNIVRTGCDVADRPRRAEIASTATPWQASTPTVVVRLPGPVVGGAVVAGEQAGSRPDCGAPYADPAPLVKAVPAGETVAPMPPQLPAQPPPPAHILIPPRASAPTPQPQLRPPRPQAPTPPPQDVPPPQQLEPPVVAPQPGAAGGGGDAGSGGSGGGGSDGGGAAEPTPARPMPPGVIRIAP